MNRTGFVGDQLSLR